MFRLVLFSVPVAILPLLVVQLVETVVSRSLLPGVANEMQRAADRADEGRPARVVEFRPPGADEGVALPLSLALRF